MRDMAVFINGGSFLWVAVEEQPYYLGVYIRAPDSWKLPYELFLVDARGLDCVK